MKIFKAALGAVLSLAMGVVGLTAFAPSAAAWSAADYNLTSMCKPDAVHGSLRLRATVADDKGNHGHYVLWQSGVGSEAAPFSEGDLTQNDTLVTVPWSGGGDTWIVKYTYGNEGPWTFTKAIGDNLLCVVPSSVTPPVYTPGNCLGVGSVAAKETDKYTWAISGTDAAKTYTATPREGVVLEGKTVYGPYDLTQTPWNSKACLPTFTVEKSCGVIKVTYQNNSPWDRWPDYTFTGDTKVPTNYGSGNTYNVVKVLAGETKVVVTKTFAEDFNGGSASVTYQDILGAERDIDTKATTVSTDTNCVAPQPEAKVTYGEWVDGTPACGDTTVKQTRTVTTTPYVLKGREWVLDPEHATVTSQIQTRDLKDTEILWYRNTDPNGLHPECYVPPMTKDATTVVTTAKWACNDKTAVTSSVTTTYTFAFDKKTGTYGEAVGTAGASVAGVRDLTASEFVACPVPDVDTSTVAHIPNLGGDVSPWGLGVSLLALLSGAGILIRRKFMA